MRRPVVVAALVLVALGGAVFWWVRRDHRPPHYTGFVEGEERIVRSEVTGRVLEVPYAEGVTVPADGVVARLDEAEIATKVAAKHRELDVIDADIRTQEDRITLATPHRIASTGQSGVRAIAKPARYRPVTHKLIRNCPLIQAPRTVRISRVVSFTPFFETWFTTRGLQWS